MKKIQHSIRNNLPRTMKGMKLEQAPFGVRVRVREWFVKLWKTEIKHKGETDNFLAFCHVAMCECMIGPKAESQRGKNIVFKDQLLSVPDQ